MLRAALLSLSIVNEAVLPVCTSRPQVPEDRDFSGEWRLIYANNGTARKGVDRRRPLPLLLRFFNAGSLDSSPEPSSVGARRSLRRARLQVVTRAVASSRSFLPRFSVSNVRQSLRKSPDVSPPALETTNEAVLGLRRAFESFVAVCVRPWRHAT